MGITLMPSTDSLTTTPETFHVTTRSAITDHVIANTSNCYLGSIIDPETRVATTSSFLAQFHIQEDYTLPEEKLVLGNDEGVVADSCVLRIYHDKFYGDSLTTMKLTVKSLSLNPENIMKEGEAYYTDINVERYLSKGEGRDAGKPLINKSFTYSVLDQNLPSSATSLSSGNYRSIPLHLGADYGTYILREYYKDPEHANFKNSYRFIHNICPGFYVQHTGGIGAMVNADVSVLDIYFKYQENDTTITKAWMRLGATEEVIQNTRFEHSNLQTMLEASDKGDFTYVKSPAAIHTEITLPLNDIIDGKNGEHSNDSINSARFTLQCYNNDKTLPTSLTPPTNLLLVRKGMAEEFFKSNSLPDNKSTFLCAYSATTNSYTFPNIAPLIGYMRSLRDKEAGLSPNDNEAQRKEKLAAWEAKNSTFELIPVSTDYSTTSSSYGGSSSVLVGINNEYNLRSVKLQKGTNADNNEVKLNVIYSHFKTEE